MISDISKLNLKLEKTNLNDAMHILINYYDNFGKGDIKQSEFDSFIYLLKYATFWKRVAAQDLSNGNYYNQMISDLISIPKYIISGEQRSLNLSIRSIIENHIRIIEHSYLRNDHITLNVFESFKNKYVGSGIISETDYSKIRSLYVSASTSIHGDIANEDTKLNILLKQVLSSNRLPLKKELILLNNLKDILNLLRICFIKNHVNITFNAFYREFTVLEFLTNYEIKMLVLNSTYN